MSRISAAAFSDTKPHYDLLDGLRGVAALTVVCFHLFEAYASSHLDQRINHGYLAVDFFFILSGFVVGYAYDDRWTKMTVREFLTRRLVRLQPMVVIGALIGAVMFYTQGCPVWDVSAVPVAMLLVATLMNAFMIPATPGAEIRGVGEMYPLNGPAWSLFFEYIGNVLYALFIRRLSTRALAVLVAAAERGGHRGCEGNLLCRHLHYHHAGSGVLPHRLHGGNDRSLVPRVQLRHFGLHHHFFVRRAYVHTDAGYQAAETAGTEELVLPQNRTFLRGYEPPVQSFAGCLLA